LPSGVILFWRLSDADRNRIDWQASGYSGTYSYTLDASGTSATGVSVLYTGRPGNYHASMRKAS